MLVIAELYFGHIKKCFSQKFKRSKLNQDLSHLHGFTSWKKNIYTYKHLKITKFSQPLGIQLRFVWRLKLVKRRISLTPPPSSDISPFIHFNLVTFHHTHVRTRFNSFLLFRDRIHHHSPSVVAVHIRAMRPAVVHCCTYQPFDGFAKWSASGEQFAGIRAQRCAVWWMYRRINIYSGCFRAQSGPAFFNWIGITLVRLIRRLVPIISSVALLQFANFRCLLFLSFFGFFNLLCFIPPIV